jgi:hypothetical protein
MHRQAVKRTELLGLVIVGVGLRHSEVGSGKTQSRAYFGAGAGLAVVLGAALGAAAAVPPPLVPSLDFAAE